MNYFKGKKCPETISNLCHLFNCIFAQLIASKSSCAWCAEPGVAPDLFSSFNSFPFQNKIRLHCWTFESHLAFEVKILDRLFLFPFMLLWGLTAVFHLFLNILLRCVCAVFLPMIWFCFSISSVLVISKMCHMNKCDSKWTEQKMSVPVFISSAHKLLHLYVYSLCASYVGQIVRKKKKWIVQMKKNACFGHLLLLWTTFMFCLPLKPINWVKGSTQSSRMRRKQAYARRPASRSRSDTSEGPFTLARKT